MKISDLISPARASSTVTGVRVAAVLPLATVADIALSSPTLDHTTDLQNAINTCPDYSVLVLPFGNYKFTNLAITKNIILDWSWSYLLVDPTPNGVTTGNPAIWFKGTVSLFSLITAITNNTNSITVTTPSSFAASDWCILGDSKIVRAWDDLNADGVADAGSSSNSSGYSGRYELNRITAIATNVFTLERNTEWTYDTSPFIKKIVPLFRPGCINISRMTEVDPGGVFTGPDIQLAPHLIKYDYCIEPITRDCTFGNYNLQAINYDTCHRPRAYRCVAYDPYRPSTGGHGYHLRFNRCTDGLAEKLTSYKVRHAVDHTQAYHCGSQDCVAVDTIISSYTFHGLSEKRCFSRNDSSVTSPGFSNTGWQVGNSSFSGSFDTTIDEPHFHGSGVGVNAGYSSNNTHVNNPRIKGVIPAGSNENFKGVLHTSGATNTFVNGGYIDGSEVFVTGSELVTARNNVVASDTIAIKPDTLYVQGVNLIGTYGDAASTVYHTHVSQCTSTIFRNNTFTYINNSSQGSAMMYDATNSNLVFEGNTFQGQTGKYGIQTTIAPTQLYKITNNSSSIAFSVAYMALTASTLLEETGNSPDVLQTLTYAATISTDPAYNASFGRPSQKTRFKVTLTGNAALGNLSTTFLRDGKTYTWYITQDATGSRLLTYQSQFKFEGGAPTLSTAANAVDILTGVWDSATSQFYCRLAKAFA